MLLINLNIIGFALIIKTFLKMCIADFKAASLVECGPIAIILKNVAVRPVFFFVNIKQGGHYLNTLNYLSVQLLLTEMFGLIA